MFPTDRLKISLAEVEELAGEFADLALCEMAREEVHPLARVFHRAVARGARLLTAAHSALREEIEALTSELAKAREECQDNGGGSDNEVKADSGETPEKESEGLPRNRKSTIQVLQFRDTMEDLAWIFRQRHPKSQLPDEDLRAAIQADLDLGIQPGEIWHMLEHTPAEADYPEVSRELRAKILAAARLKEARMRDSKRRWEARQKAKRQEAPPA